MQYAQFFGFYQNDSYYSFNPVKFLGNGNYGKVHEYTMIITNSDQRILTKQVIVKKFINEDAYYNEKLLWITIKNVSETIKCKLKYFSDLNKILIYDYLGLPFDSIKSNLFKKFNLCNKLKIIKNLINEIYDSISDNDNYIIHCDIKPANFVVDVKFDNLNQNIISVEGTLIDYGDAFIKEFLNDKNFKSLTYTQLYSNPLTYEVNKLINSRNKDEILTSDFANNIKDKLIKSQYWAISSIIICIIYNDGDYYRKLINEYFNSNRNNIQLFLMNGINSQDFFKEFCKNFHNKINDSQSKLLSEKIDDSMIETQYELKENNINNLIFKNNNNPFKKNQLSGGNFYPIEISDKLLQIIISLFEYKLSFNEIKKMSDLL
jgi:hypothetical protein